MDDFHELDQIKSRFEDWRTKHSESYNEAYIGLCLPKLFTPLVKLGLITWNPLQVRYCDYKKKYMCQFQD